jgi:N-acetylmuramic acid 6-phosphate etherase
MQAKNQKLERRTRRIVSEAAGVSGAEAEDLLIAAKGSAKVAVVMGKTGLTASAARMLLDGARGNVRLAIEAAGGGGRGRP